LDKNLNFMMNLRKICFFLILIFACNFVYADESVNLLAVTEIGLNNQSIGTLAKMKLNVNNGTGNIFFNTYPFSRVDTQISSRIANSVACKYISDCNHFDYYYTIDIDSSSIGGPSAGAAITILTMSKLLNHDIHDDFAITGTINSGGIIGPVGGIEEKVKAAINSGMKKIVIPFGENKIKKFNETMPKLYFDNVKVFFKSYENFLFFKSKLENDSLFVLNNSKLDNFKKSFNYTDVTIVYLNHVEPIFKIDFKTEVKETDQFISFFKKNYKALIEDSIIEYKDVKFDFYVYNDSVSFNNISNLNDLRNDFDYTFDLIKFANESGADLRTYVNILDAYEFATDLNILNDTLFNLSISNKYSDILNILADDLCGEFNNNFNDFNFDNLDYEKYSKIDFIFKDRMDLLKNNSLKLNELLNLKKYYTAASICFSNSIALEYIKSIINYSNGLNEYSYYFNESDILLKNYTNYKIEIDNLKINSLIDIQTIGIIKNRLIEVKTYLDFLTQDSFNKTPDVYLYNLAFAKYRFKTSKAWKVFYNTDKNLNLDDSVLQTSCNSILVEVQERFSYISTISNFPLNDLKKEVDNLNKYYFSGDYVQCIYESAVLKARLDNVLTSGGFSTDDLIGFYEIKKSIVKNNLNAQLNRGYFPILGYSYLEYADYLKNDSIGQALHFLSLSLELNNIDIYLPSDLKSNGFLKPAINGTFIMDNGDLNNSLYFSIFLILTLLTFSFFRRNTINLKLNNEQKKQLEEKNNILVVKPEHDNLLFNEKLNKKINTFSNDLFDDSFRKKLFKKLKK